MSNNLIWVVGAGYMAQEYAKVLQDMQADFVVISRGTKNAQTFKEKFKKEVVVGGLKNYISTSPEKAEYAIVATGPESMFENCKDLLEFGIKNIMLEKPAGVNSKEIREICDLAKKSQAKISVAYNRRFYQSVIEAKKLIEQDGGVTSFEFDFTEWSHQIEKIEGKLDIELNNWFYANSTHVIDLAFYLGGKPKSISSNVAGGLSWHKAGSVFSGSGESVNGALFCYHANWESAGRWSVEINTLKHKFILRPLEKLQICDRGSVAIYLDEGIDYKIDTEFKPGIYLETKAFLAGDFTLLKTIEEQVDDSKIYDKMLGV